jgi:glycosyltransferase involved in cell wall biosynthesis
MLGLFLDRRPDAVHLWQDTVNIAGGLAALMAGVPSIVMATRSTRPDARRRMRRYLEPGYRALLALPHVRMVNNSRNGARDYEDWLDLPERSVGVIHNGFDVDKIRSTADTGEDAVIRQALGIPEGAPVIGGVMRFSEEKRPELFVEAALALAPRLPEAHFVLVGEGPLRAELAARVADRGLAGRIHMPGAKRPIEPWMRMMSLLVLTSRMEGLPNVLIEAQILGVPVAATQVGGVPETMKPGETGIMVDSGDPAVLADALHGLLSDQARLKAMGAAAGPFAERAFGLDGMIARTIAHYEGRDPDAG